MKPLLETLSEILPKEKDVTNKVTNYDYNRAVYYNQAISEVKLLLPQIIEAVVAETTATIRGEMKQDLPIKCDYCDNVATHIQEPDPYSYEIRGDQTPCNLCNDCYHSSCMAI